MFSVVDAAAFPTQGVPLVIVAPAAIYDLKTPDAVLVVVANSPQKSNLKLNSGSANDVHVRDDGTVVKSNPRVCACRSARR